MEVKEEHKEDDDDDNDVVPYRYGDAAPVVAVVNVSSGGRR